MKTRTLVIALLKRMSTEELAVATGAGARSIERWKAGKNAMPIFRKKLEQLYNDSRANG